MSAFNAAFDEMTYGLPGFASFVASRGFPPPGSHAYRALLREAFDGYPSLKNEKPDAPATPTPSSPHHPRLKVSGDAFVARSVALLACRGVDRLTGSRIRVEDCTPEKRQALDILAGFKARSPFSGVRFDDLLSFETGQALVFKGSFGAKTVAIKTFLKAGDYESEVRIFKRLGSTHPNILPLIHHDKVSSHGICVVPLAPGGSLNKALNTMKLPEAVAKQYGEQIASALVYMHSLRLAHRDIKADNILLDARNVPLLMDFGLTEAFSGTGRDNLDEVVGTMQFCAPEVVSDMGKSCLSKTDVWSFGMLLYEMLSGKIPYLDLFGSGGVAAWNHLTAEHIASGRTPELADRWATPKMKKIIQSCWTMDPTKRPTMKAIESALA